MSILQWYKNADTLHSSTVTSPVTLHHRSSVTRRGVRWDINDCCIANFLEIVNWKNFKNRPILIDEVQCRAFGVHFFGATCIHALKYFSPAAAVKNFAYTPLFTTTSCVRSYNDRTADTLHSSSVKEPSQSQYIDCICGWERFWYYYLPHCCK